MKTIKRIILNIRYRSTDAFRILFKKDNHYIIMSLTDNDIINFHTGKEGKINIRYRFLTDYHFCEVLRQVYLNLDTEFVNNAKIKNDKKIEEINAEASVNDQKNQNQ
jgi:hypothetical protein